MRCLLVLSTAAPLLACGARQKSTNNGLTTSKTWSLAPMGSCWSDLVGDVRTLDTPLTTIDSNRMTAKACLDGCASLGFSLAGLEWGRECFCGNTIIGDNRPVAEERCNSACTGNKSQNCGGPAALNIYIRENFQMKIGPATALSEYKGYSPKECWRDSATNRIFPDRANPDIDRNTMTVEKCIDNCADQSYTSAGLEFGGECYCGNVTYPIGTVAPSSECNMACLGDSTQLCGGIGRIQAYHKQPSTLPVTMRGIIQVTNATNGNVLGFLSKNALDNRQFRYQPNEADAMTITFPTPDGVKNVSRARFTSLNSGTTFSLVGFVQGRDNTNSDLNPSSFHYGYISGTNASPQGAGPQSVGNLYTSTTGTSRTSESDVWTVDLASGAITGQWINQDGSSPNISLVSQMTALYVVGDRAAFATKYTAATTDITLQFLSRSA